MKCSLNLSGKDAAELLECIDNPVECKNMLYPDVREYILTKDLSFSGGSFTLSVGTAPVRSCIRPTGISDKKRISGLETEKSFSYR